MYKSKRFLSRFFSMKTDDLMRLCFKISVFLIFSLYFFNYICDYFTRRFYEHTRQVLVETHEKINRKSQKNLLETDYQETLSALEYAKNQSISTKSITAMLQDLAKQQQIEIDSYTTSEQILRESYTKTIINYKMSSNAHNISQFLSLIKQHQLPISCNNLALNLRENNIYQLQLTIIERKKPLQPAKQAEGLGGEQ